MEEILNKTGMVTIEIESNVSTDNMNHKMEIPEVYLEKVDPMFARTKGVLLSLSRSDNVTLRLGCANDSEEGIWFEASSKNGTCRRYYFSEKSYHSVEPAPNVWSERCYYESSSDKKKYLGVHYQMRGNYTASGYPKKGQMVHGIYSDASTRKWEVTIPGLRNEEVRPYEIALTTHPRIEELITYVTCEFEKTIPGITEFLSYDRRFRNLQDMMEQSVSEKYNENINKCLYAYFPSDFEECDSLTNPGRQFVIDRKD